jgi:hypothetical protein
MVCYLHACCNSFVHHYPKYIIFQMNDWSDDIESVLENIRINSILFSNYHKERYYVYKSYLKYFKLPLIVLSSLTSIASVGLTTYISQEKVSAITCLLSLLSAIIASVELYLGIQKSMEIELLSSRDFILLAYDVYKTLNLSRENRSTNGKVYLDDKYQEYKKLVENAKLINSKKLKDALAPLPINVMSMNSSTPNGSNASFDLKL